MKTVIKYLIILLIIIFPQLIIAQNSAKIKPILTADSLRSGNAKDILTSFFQLAFNKLTGPNKELNFSSNPFAILLKSDPDLAIDRSYYKYRPLRKINFSFGLKLDTSYRFNGFSSGIKYALIDKRDSSTSKLLFENLRNDSLANEVNELQKELVEYANKNYPVIAEKKKFIAKTNDLLNRNIPFNKLDTAIQRLVTQIIGEDEDAYPHINTLVRQNPASNIFEEQRKQYNIYRNEIKNDLLWTLGLSDTTYKDDFIFSNILINTELVKGFGKPKPGSNWEFNIKAGINFIDDRLNKGRDLKRTLLNFEPGVNWVIRNKKNDHSFLELAFSGSYHHNFRNLYANERRDSVTVNTIIRVRIISDIWVPLEIKYDPKSGNVFGFLNVRVNFKALGKLGKDLL